MNNNKPDIAIVGLKYLEDLRKRADIAEENDALDSVNLYLKEKKEGKLKILKSSKDLVK